MRHISWFVVLFALFATPCFAQKQCPWMNAATAAGFLGGDVQMSISNVTVEGDVTCEFARTRSSAGASSMLRIAVHTMPDISKQFAGYVSQCGANALTLKGVGNTAVQCMSKDEELIVGRVRERAFVITIKADWIKDPPTSPSKTRNAMSDESENIAEQVAGSMF